MNYRREIDGLRAIAVVPVILFHGGLSSFSGGFVGVDVFFVISGYLITSIILAEQKAGKFSLLGFYERRARRILPALFMVMLVCVPLAWLMFLPSDMKAFSESLAAVAVFSSNILFFRQSGYFDAAAELKPLLHTWSLAVEEQYYLFFPLWLLLTWRWGLRWIVATLLVAAMVSLALAQWGAQHSPTAAFYLLPTRGWELLIGAFIAFYFSAREASASEAPPWGGGVQQTMSLLGLALIFYPTFYFDENTPFPGVYALWPTLGAGLVIFFANQQTWVGKLLGSKLLVGIGLISYSAYLWHQPLFAFARHGSGHEPGTALVVTLSVSALGLAYLSWKYVEVPFRNKQLIARPQLFASSLLGSLVFFSFGLYGHYSAGFSSRYAPEDRYLAELDFADQGKYVRQRFNEMQLRAFDGSSKKKVVVIGDSYAQDLVNALVESGLAAGMQLSTFHISKDCGNLFLKKDFTTNIGKANIPQCRSAGWYENKALHALMDEADAIWVVSAWQYWQAELLPESVQNLKKTFGEKVLVFGRKNFGDFRIKDLLAKPPGERYAVKSTMNAEHVRTNELMGAELPNTVYLDVSALLCGDKYRCPLFTDEGQLISYDGGHLTKAGAKYYGEKLSRHPLIRPFLANS